ncbi:MAG: class I SAM-dependent methyltransferase [Candidatus Sumerlaeia bacterium]|nr:class I SAM-dependent methyltransferase [Candidatus Sumerlaeia bacterium]
MSVPCRCGESRARKLFDLRRDGLPGRFTVVRCVRCGLERLDPPPDGATLARAYATDYYGDGAKKFVGPMAAAVRWFQGGRARLVRRHLPRRARRPRLLDVGCGNGGFLRDARRAGFEVEGTELTAESARRAAPKGDLTVHVGDLLSLNLPEESYDAATLWHVFEHVPDAGATLRELRRVVRPGGLLFLSLPNAGSWQARATGRHWFHRDPPRHLWHWSAATLRRALRDEGFDTVAVDHWSFEQNPYGWLQSLLNQWGFPQDGLYEVLKRQRPWSWLTPGHALAAVAAGALAFPLSVLESLAGAGGAITVVARRR